MSVITGSFWPGGMHSGERSDDRFDFGSLSDNHLSTGAVHDAMPSSGNTGAVFLNYFIFAVFAGEALATGTFRANAEGVATQPTDRVILETDTGNLFYDSDGSGSAASVPLTTIENHSWLAGFSALFAGDFFQL